MLRSIFYSVVFLTASYAFADVKKATKAVEGKLINVILSTNGNDIAFDQTALQVPMAETVSMRFSNEAAKGSEILHNVAILKPGSLDVFLVDLQKSGYDIEKVKNHPSVLAMTAALLPGSNEVLNFQPPGPGFYPYVCVMAGHADMLGMKGVLNITAPQKSK